MDGKPEKRLPRRRTKRVKTAEPLAEKLFYDDLAPSREPHPLTPAGPKLKVLREQSGWTVSEIADRTGVRLEVLAAFEQGAPAAASQLELSDLERLASACLPRPQAAARRPRSSARSSGGAWASSC